MGSGTWFITGAAHGFGREITEQLLARGDRVVATARRPAQLAALREEHPERLWTACLDVTDPGGIRSVVDRAFAALGRIDVVVSSAGYGLSGAVEELSDAEIERQVATNLLGSIRLTRAVLPHLRAQGGGRFVQLSSMGGQWASPGLSVYHATKWGIEGFLEALIPEVAPRGIEVTMVEPGALCTNFSAARGDPGKMAAAIIASVEGSPAPKRLTLGSDAYSNVKSALEQRLAALQAQRDLALSTDVDDAAVPPNPGGTSAREFAAR